MTRRGFTEPINHDKLRQLIAQDGRPPQVLAADAGISTRHIWRLLGNQESAGIGTLDALACELGVHLEALIVREGVVA